MDGWCNRWVGQVSPSSLDVALISALNISEIVVDKSAVKIHLPIKRKKKNKMEKTEYYGSKGIAFFSVLKALRIACKILRRN